MKRNDVTLRVLSAANGRQGACKLWENGGQKVEGKELRIPEVCLPKDMFIIKCTDSTVHVFYNKTFGEDEKNERYVSYASNKDKIGQSIVKEMCLLFDSIYNLTEKDAAIPYNKELFKDVPRTARLHQRI